jgi:hypothetical protein
MSTNPPEDIAGWPALREEQDRRWGPEAFPDAWVGMDSLAMGLVPLAKNEERRLYEIAQVAEALALLARSRGREACALWWEQVIRDLKEASEVSHAATEAAANRYDRLRHWALEEMRWAHQCNRD